MSLEDFVIQRLSDHEGSDFSPCFSPDGKRLVYVSRRGDHHQLWIMNSDATNAHPLTNDPLDHFKPNWSPDGARIVYFSREASTTPGAVEPTSISDLWMIRVDGSDHRRLTHHEAFDEDPTWSPDASTIAFTADREGGGGRIWLLEPGGSAPWPLLR